MTFAQRRNRLTNAFRWKYPRR